MKLIKNLVITKIEDDHYLIINTLNGLMDRVNEIVMEVLRKWSVQERIEVQSEGERELYDRLETRGYLCSDEEEERKRKDAIIQSLRERQVKHQAKIRGLTFVMTYDCNFRCPYCFESVDKSLCGQSITEEHVDVAFKFAGEDLEHIGLFGGEPLLPRNRKTIEYLIRKAPEKSYDVITNGYYLDRYIDLLSKVHVKYVMVTLDGKKETHDKRRFLANGKPTFDKIVENIGNCLQHKIPVRIRMNIDQDMFGESEELRDLLLQKFQNFSECLSFEISPMMEMQTPERNDLLHSLVEKDRTRVSSHEKNVLLSRFSPIVNSLLYRKTLRPTYSRCLDHQSNYIVDPLGFVYPCLVAVGKQQFAVGSYYPEAKFFENSVRSRNIESIEKCRSCEYSLLCGGGCPIKLGDCKNVYQPECGSIANDIHRLLPLFLNSTPNKTESM